MQHFFLLSFVEYANIILVKKTGTLYRDLVSRCINYQAMKITFLLFYAVLHT